MPQRRDLHRAGLGLGIAALVFLAFTAFKWGLADIHAAQGRELLGRWEVGRAAPQTAEWERALRAFRRAIVLNPRSPDLLEDLGRVQEWRVIDAPPGDHQAADDRRRALALYRQAIRLRPIWPFSWANLALVKYRLAEIDEEFEYALVQATTLGPWESSVQSAVATSGMGAWNTLSRDARQVVYENVLRGLKRRPRLMLQTAEDSGLLRVFCYTLPDDPVVQRYCEQNMKGSRAAPFPPEDSPLPAPPPRGSSPFLADSPAPS